MKDNYTVYHIHSDTSNPTTSMAVDSITKFYQYLDLAQEQGMTSFCFSEHGSVMNWIKKKQEVEKRNMKYIHANEVYLTQYLDREKGLIRDNYHYMLIARNLDGVKELNKLTSTSNNKKDGHYYYNPRISFDELFNTSDNIIMTSACLASPLWRAIKTGNKQMEQKLLDFFVKNKHRMFLEIQYHDHPEQSTFNQWLYDFSKNAGIPLIAGTDTHALNREHAEARKILMRAKKATYGDEDVFDLTFKSYTELVAMFEQQAAIPREAYLEAIHNTNVMADMIEPFQLDTTPKYPKLHDNSEQVFKEKINEGIVIRGINKFEKEKRDTYYERVREEFDTYKKVGAIDYMLLQKNIIDWCHENEIYQGYGRGSVNGSLIAYILKITEMDSIKHKLNFFRFLNPERISLADIDVDFPPSRRQEVIDYVATIPNIHFCEIITFNTVALKGAIREVGRGLGMELDTVDEIAKSVFKNDNKKDDIDPKYREKYPELFKYVDLVSGVIMSIGSHPSGYVVSPVNLEEEVGTCFTKESKYPVSQVNMKELDGCNFVKLDILGLDNIEIINETCKMAGIERLTPDNMDTSDLNVWSSMKDSGLGIFQWESDSAHAYYKSLFSDETIDIIKNTIPDFDLIQLFSVGNAAIRPSGDSYRYDLAKGIFKDHGHEALNKFLQSTLGYLIFQEQIMNFLVEFADFSMSESDSVRRGMSKKGGTEEFLPEISKRFIDKMVREYGETQDSAKAVLDPFTQVIIDAKDYGFSDNHSNPYSHIGYGNGYLRHYRPLEFLTVILNINDDDIKKTGKIAEYAALRDIQIKPIKFRKSLSMYTASKADNSIYKGMKSIKYLNKQVSEELYELRDNTYDTFVDLLIDIVEKTSVDARQLQILIKLNYFSEFGFNNELLEIHKEFSASNGGYKKTHKHETKTKRIAIIKEKESYIKANFTPKSIPPYEQIIFEKEMLGYSDYKKPDLPDEYSVVLEIDTKYAPRLTMYDLITGEEYSLKIEKKKFYRYGDSIVSVGDMLKNPEFDLRNKKKKTNEGYIDLEEKEKWLTGASIIKAKKENVNEKEEQE